MMEVPLKYPVAKVNHPDWENLLIFTGDERKTPSGSVAVYFHNLRFSLDQHCSGNDVTSIYFTMHHTYPLALHLQVNKTQI